jgi:hypothetical protein
MRPTNHEFALFLQTAMCDVIVNPTSLLMSTAVSQLANYPGQNARMPELSKSRDSLLVKNEAPG